MRLLLINSIGKNKWGGGEKWMILAAKGLISKGHQVTIACHKHSILEQKTKEENIPFTPVSIYTDLSLSGYYQLKHFIKHHQPELIIACQNKDVRIAGYIAKQLGFPIVLSRQGVQLLHNLLKYRLGFYPFCHGIITNTHSIKKEYDSYGWWDDKYVKVIHNGVTTVKEVPNRFDYSDYLPSEEKKPFIVLSTGRLTTQKGFKFLIEAARNIVAQHQNAHFFIAGQGKLEKELKTLTKRTGLSENIHFLGFQNDIPALLAGADLFVLPSLYEGMPNSVMEALAHGLPVVCTQVNGVSELMNNGEHGITIPPGDPKALEEAILQLMGENELKTLGTKGQQHVEKNFSIERMVENLENHLLEQIASRPKKARKFLIIQTAFIGDVILATPVIEKLKRFYPDSTIDILVRKGNEGLLMHNPHLNKIIIFDKQQGKYKNLIKLIKTVRIENYYAVINIQRYFTTGLITALSKAVVKIGFKKNPLAFLYTKAIAHKMHASEESDHEVKRNLSLIESLTDDSFEMPKMYPSQEDFEKVKHDKEYYCLAPTSVWFTKQYPAERWVELMNSLPRESTLFLLGGPGDKSACQVLLEQTQHPDVRNKAGELSFLESAALMKGARMNFVNDSAPLHICSAVNAPVRALFCSTVPAFGYTPLSDNSRVLEISTPLNCKPCGLHGKRACPKGHFKCGNIPINAILNSITHD
ncbi:MAG: glycosyltransferase [Marinilabiliaceae bacterium]|nr:glycosyltransferase [Marinilabiliaceae bacterium]